MWKLSQQLHRLAAMVVVGTLDLMVMVDLMRAMVPAPWVAMVMGRRALLHPPMDMGLVAEATVVQLPLVVAVEVVEVVEIASSAGM